MVKIYKKFHNVRGVSLISVIISSGLGVFLIAGALSVAISTKISFTKIEAQATLQSQIRFTTDLLTAIIGQAGHNLTRREPYASTEKLATTATTALTKINQINNWNYLGCYIDPADVGTANRVLNTELTGTTIAKPADCINTTNMPVHGKFFSLASSGPTRKCYTNTSGILTIDKLTKAPNSACDAICADQSNCGGNDPNKYKTYALYEKYYQYITGEVGDNITVLFRGDGVNIIDCTGNVVANGNIARNKFYVNNNQELICDNENPLGSVTTSSIIAKNIIDLKILYGEDITGDGQVNRYVPINYNSLQTANNYFPLDQNYITAVQIKIIFRDSQKQQLTFYKTINLNYIFPLERYIYLNPTGTTVFTAPMTGKFELKFKGGDAIRGPGAYINVGGTIYNCKSYAGIANQDNSTNIVPACIALAPVTVTPTSAPLITIGREPWNRSDIEIIKFME